MNGPAAGVGASRRLGRRRRRPYNSRRELAAKGRAVNADCRRIAMWSGPRNVSTALLRAWGQRADAAVVDEPFYACYLQRTGLPHPGADEVIRSQPTDWRVVADSLTGPAPGGKAAFYQKHMAHHMLPEIGLDWMLKVDNAFLIREPAAVIVSLAKVTPNAGLEDTGYPQLWRLYEWVRERAGRAPPVVDSRELLLDPRRVLGLLCDALGVPFDDAMLSWPPGPRDTDGVWAKHWYDAVLRSTGFEPYRPRTEPVPDRLKGVLAEAEDLYARLHAVRLGQ